MQQTFKKYWWIIITILVTGLSFYWYEWRPTQIRKECAKENIGVLYENCVHEKGLEE